MYCTNCGNLIKNESALYCTYCGNKLHNGPPTTPVEESSVETRFDVIEIEKLHGKINALLICPHCQNKGSVRTKRIMKKVGISGAKATGAIFTGGLSLIATGLSKKEQITEAYCDNCNSTWQF